MRIDYRHVVAYLLIVSGIIMALWIGWALARAYLTHGWPQTNAIIYKSAVTYTTSTPTQKYYTIDLQYHYKIKNKTYTNQKIYLTDLPFLKLTEAEKLVDYYAVGSIHKLSYNPSFPEDSVLKPGVSNVLLLLAALTILFLSIGLATRKK